MPIETRDSVQRLLEQHFGGPIKIGTQLTPEFVGEVISATGVGLNHTIGERVLAIGDNSKARPLQDLFMLTDRQIAGRHFNSFYQAQLDEITDVSEGRTLGIPNVRLQTLRGVVEVKMGRLSRDLYGFLSELCQLPAGMRTPKIDPIPAPTTPDLLTDQWANANAPLLDPVCEQMLWIVLARFRRGDFSFDAAGNLIGRILVHSRNARFGRGMLSGWWTSPLSVGDLQEAIQQLLGPPTRVMQQPNLVAGEFSLAKTNAAGKAVASSAVGLAAAAFLGVGWISIPAKSISKLRVSLSSAPGMTCVQIEGADGSRFEQLSITMPRLLAKCHELFGRFEQALLYRRALYGWEEGPGQLLAKPEADIRERLQQAIDLNLREIAVQDTHLMQATISKSSHCRGPIVTASEAADDPAH